MQKEKLETILRNEFAENKIYQETLKIAKKNSEGRIWLIGGLVFRALAHHLYGSRFILNDVDFLFEKLNREIIVPKEWSIRSNRFGNPKLIKNGIVIDLIPLKSLYCIQSKNLKPNIENCLNGAPLTVQSIAFDIGKQTLIGDVGIESLINKTVGINNQEEYDHVVSVGKVYSLKKYAKELGFKVIKK